MYHIKDDKRSKRSARLISETLLQCLREQDFSEITISQISQVSYVGRATFYRLFDNLSDVISYLCDKVTLDIETQLQVFPNINERDRMLLILDRWMHEEFLLDTLLFHDLDTLLFDSFSHIINKTVAEKPQISEDLTAHRIYFNTVFQKELTAVLQIWSLNGKKESASQLVGYLREIHTLQLKYL